MLDIFSDLDSKELSGFINTDSLGHYGSGEPTIPASQLANDLAAGSLFGQQSSNDFVACCESAIWLLHNHLEESHEISQRIKTPEGSLWHGIMHRLEGDYWNSKYWYRQAGLHPVMSELNELVSNVNVAEPSQSFTHWDSNQFVDLCETVDSNPGHLDRGYCQQLMQLEWLTLFRFCLQRASH